MDMKFAVALKKTLRKSVNRMLKRILGPKGDGVTRGCTTFLNEEFHNL